MVRESVAFMSPGHVASMNALLTGARDVLRHCQALGRRYVVAYELTDGPAGAAVHWRVSFDPVIGVRFGLTAPATDPDVVLRGDWCAMVRASAARRAGTGAAPGLRIDGDPGVLVAVGPALEAARAVATVPVTFPDLG